MTDTLVSCVVAQGVATVTLRNPPVNALSNGLRAALLSSLRELADRDDLSAVILTATGRSFIAGADITEMDLPPEQPYLPEITQAITRMRVPVIAAINGACLGGGLEIGLACDARFAAPGALLGLPETRLGIIPGAGGTQRLPRLVGLERAIDMICAATTVDAATAKETGLIDEVADDVLAYAVANAATTPKRDLGRQEFAALDTAGMQQLRRRFVDSRRSSDAVRSAFDVLAASPALSFEEGLALERETFLRLRDSAAARALRYVFKAERRAGHLADKATIQEISRIAVAGGGTMGSGIAQACLSAGLHVTVLERDAQAADGALTRIEDAVDTSTRRGRISPEQAKSQLSRLTVGHDPAAAAQCDMLIEAVFEDYDVKRALFDAVKPHLSPSTLVASNTSYLDIDRLARIAPEPGSFIGMHFFAPASMMKLVEVIPGAATTPSATASIVRFARRLGKTPVIAGNAEGFIGNRIFSAYRRAMEYLVEDGASPLAIDEALEEYGFAMGPFSVFDMSGLDIAWAMRKRNAATRDPRQRYVRIADRLCEMGHFGRKTGMGWYDHSGKERKLNANAVRLIEEERQAKGIVGRDVTPDEIVETALASMRREGEALLEEGIAACPSDIDVVMVLGYGFPRDRGGPIYSAAPAP